VAAFYLNPSTKKHKTPCILIITPGITYLPKGMENLTQRMTAKVSNMADVSASLDAALHEQKADACH